MFWKQLIGVGNRILQTGTGRSYSLPKGNAIPVFGQAEGNGRSNDTLETHESHESHESHGPEARSMGPSRNPFGEGTGAPVQSELDLPALSVVRNDLADEDLEVVQVTKRRRRQRGQGKGKGKGKVANPFAVSRQLQLMSE